jgi:hypothetical protein
VGSESEESVIVVGSRTPGPSLVGIFAAGASLFDTSSPSEGGGKGVESGGIGGTEAHKGVGSPWGPPLIWVSMAFHIFPCSWKLLPSWLP